MNDLKLIVLDNIKDLGKKIDGYLKHIYKTEESFIVNITRDRFNNGEGKIKINEDIENKTVYIISDVANYSITYKMYGFIHNMAPDEHFQDIKRVISAVSGYAKKIVVIMPLLYQSRQDRRSKNESLDCAMALQELENLGVDKVITFDVHNIDVINAIPNKPFESYDVTNEVLNSIETNESIEDVLVISPDMGAAKRAKQYAELLKTDIGVFYKRRDITSVVDGKNKIIEHIYLGPSVKDKNIIVVDDMIASGASMIDTIKELKAKGAKNIYLVTTFAFFTEGTNYFDEAYNNKLFTKLYSTNLSYIPDNIKAKEWFMEVDCADKLANIITK